MPAATRTAQALQLCMGTVPAPGAPALARKAGLGLGLCMLQGGTACGAVMGETGLGERPLLRPPLDISSG